MVLKKYVRKYISNFKVVFKVLRWMLTSAPALVLIRPGVNYI